jgi:hypothetical protein
MLLQQLYEEIPEATAAVTKTLVVHLAAQDLQWKPHLPLLDLGFSCI